MAMDTIRIRGARTHNLKNIDLDLPRDKLIVITGLSGSGKSSLAFDTIYAEGQRRYVESLSAYARQFLSVMEKPDVDHIEGLSPAISIEQKSTSHNPRSTVGTITEIYDYLRLLYARVGTPRCPDHGYPLEAQTVSQMVDQVLALGNDADGCRAALDAAGAGDPRAQGRACAGVRAAARAGLRARARRRRAARDRRGAAAGAAREAHHRSGDRPLQGARRHQAAAGRIVRDRAEARRRHGHGAVARRRQVGAAAVLLEIQLPGLRLLVAGTRAAAVLVQLAGRRLPRLRRPRRHPVLRSRARGRASGTVARRRRGARLGPAQRLLLPADPVAGQALRLRRRHAVAGAAGGIAPGGAVRQRQGRDQLQLHHRCRRPHPAQAQVRGHRAEPRTPLPRNRIRGGARGAGEVHQRTSLPRLRRRAPEPLGAQRVRRRPTAARSGGAADRRGAGVLRAARSCRAGAARSRPRSSRKSASA